MRRRYLAGGEGTLGAVGLARVAGCANRDDGPTFEGRLKIAQETDAMRYVDGLSVRMEAR